MQMDSQENKIELGLAEKNYEHLNKFRNFLQIKNKIAYRDSTKSYRLSFRSKKCKQDLIALGCIPCKSLLLHFPNSQQVPDYLIKHFIRGYFDGDGWFSNTTSCFQVGIIGTEMFILGFLQHVNFITTTNKIFDVHRVDGAKRYVFSKHQDVYAFLGWIYDDATIYLERKYQHYQDLLINGIQYHKKKCRVLK